MRTHQYRCRTCGRHFEMTISDSECEQVPECPYCQGQDIDMKLADPDTKGKITARLRRIEGQVRVVEKMVDEDRDCHEILQQLNSIRSAVQGASLLFLHEAAADCLLNIDSIDRSQRDRYWKKCWP